MKIRDGFLLKQVVDTYVVVPVGDNLLDFSAMFSLNETGAFLWNLLKDEITVEELAEKMCQEYNVTKETAFSDINDFLAGLIKQGIIENG